MSNNQDFIPFHVPSIDEGEINAVLQCLKSGWLTTGPEARAFEEEFAAYIGVKHAVAVNSGTSALHLALEAVGIGQGDRVLTTPYTFTATAEVIRYLGADPVFADIDAATLNISPDAAASLLGDDPAIKGIVPVHVAGMPCQMDRLFELADRFQLATIEDAAHALPAAFGGRTIGTLSDATAFSFYATKTLAAGEGGMLVTDNADIAGRAKVMRLHGIDRDAFDRYSAKQPSWYYEIVAPGFKYNMSDILAAIGREQLRKGDAMHRARSEIAARYTDAFQELPVRLPEPGGSSDTHAWHLYILQLELEALSVDRNRFIDLMTEAGIGTSVHFIPLHMHPYWRDRYHLTEQDFPVATDCYRRAVSLPIYPAMSETNVVRVIDTVRSLLAEHKR